MICLINIIMFDPLLTREEFKKQVFEKTNGKCCVPGCTCDAADAHHIMDRKLWNDGGYYITNGAALCSKHHLDAEHGIITPLQCMDWMGINPGIVRKPDKVKEIFPRDNLEYMEALVIGLINKWGE